ncbi:hypothetical protein Q8G35_07435 [Peribacillus simplex]|uniref:Uncharacterized protein n=2 Tax=Peribacillus TaxID=2675229 RepID=A0AA90P116_9BACI|nr:MULTISPECIES: hypothetical protein [Peribacillus]MDP1418240.1 hypothetical protein [Peribacillus simplex]MDP1451117.1 hypothetical protein [Peribacillus frigoritolerans]
MDQDSKAIQELQELKQKVSHLEDLITEQANKKDCDCKVVSFLNGQRIISFMNSSISSHSRLENKEIVSTGIPNSLFSA